MLFAIFGYRFIQNAVLAGFFASVLCGIIGVIVVEKKLLMMSGGIAHISYGGVGLGYLLGFEPFLGALGISFLSAIGMGYIKKKGKIGSDVMIALLWSLGMALGILFISLMKGYPPDISSYLFGSILSVTSKDLYLMAGMSLFVVLMVLFFFDYWRSYMFDEEFAAIAGIRTSFLGYLMFVMIAMTVAVLIRVVGIILVIALLTAPAALAKLAAQSLKSRMILSMAAGCLFCLLGLMISYATDISSGASIVILSVMSYFTAYLVLLIKKRKADRRNV